MTKLTYKKRVWIIKQYKKDVSPSKIAQAQRIHRSRLYQIIEKYNEYGWDGLKDHKTGRPEIVLNPKAQDMILEIRKKYGYGALSIEQILRKKGFSISHRQIEKTIVRAGLVKPNVKKQKPRKWVRYELPNPNDLWHTDWTVDPFTEKKLSAYIDDRTRLILSYGLFDKASAENSIALLNAGISEYGKPKAIMTDHGSQFYANRDDAIEQNTQFRITLNVLGIKHYLARINRPQTNGKIGRWFGTYKEEYLRGSFSGIKDFVKCYNEKRLHMSLDYRTPLDVWKELNNV
jgi:putative transposase